MCSFSLSHQNEYPVRAKVPVPLSECIWGLEQGLAPSTYMLSKGLNSLSCSEHSCGSHSPSNSEDSQGLTLTFKAILGPPKHSTRNLCYNQTSTPGATLLQPVFPCFSLLDRHSHRPPPWGNITCSTSQCSVIHDPELP